MIWLALILVLVALFYIYIVLPHRYWKNNGIQYVEPTPIFGNFYENLIKRKSFADLIESFYKQLKQYRYCGIYNLTTPILIINDLDLIKTITIKDFDYFTDHMNHAREEVDPVWSRGLFAMIGEPWRDMRSILSPAFTSSKMRNMFNLINDSAEHFAEFYLKQNKDIISLEMKDAFTKATTDIIASCAFGIQCDSLNDSQNDFYVKARNAFDFSGFRKYIFFMYNTFPTVMKMLGFKIFSDDIANFFRSVINETIHVREKNGIIRPDMIHLLLEARKGKFQKETTIMEDSYAATEQYSLNRKTNKIQISNEDIMAQALIFFFGGYDTTSFLMCFLAYELAVNPDVQEKLRQEIQDTLEVCNGKVTYDALIKMKYLDMIISEVLRKWPPAPLLDRICTKNYTIKATRSYEQDYQIKKKDVVWIPVFGIHRDPEFYPNPEMFDPERFSAANRGNINASAYLPFGSGPRNCIGSRFAIMENKTIIFQLLRRFSIVPTEKTDIPMKISVKQINVTANNGFWLGLKRL
ncbi:PREDICTED: cytochrome P450 9e2-like [Nicrophorus vespilloides]|uniref:Cytochrome P450 9e2-like n=1 Tax=Nicrophorus vespilloides TaxID=110193 RepID=A0ABM1M4K0_NICVS|nr:PREDICTED: cytochrome P450 9e2-like [Nicrophorus vespilloides]